MAAVVEKRLFQYQRTHDQGGSLEGDVGNEQHLLRNGHNPLEHFSSHRERTRQKKAPMEGRNAGGVTVRHADEGALLGNAKRGLVGAFVEFVVSMADGGNRRMPLEGVRHRQQLLLGPPVVSVQEGHNLAARFGEAGI